MSGFARRHPTTNIFARLRLAQREERRRQGLRAARSTAPQASAGFPAGFFGFGLRPARLSNWRSAAAWPRAPGQVAPRRSPAAWRVRSSRRRCWAVRTANPAPRAPSASTGRRQCRRSPSLSLPQRARARRNRRLPRLGGRDNSLRRACLRLAARPWAALAKGKRKEDWHCRKRGHAEDGLRRDHRNRLCCRCPSTRDRPSAFRSRLADFPLSAA